MSTIDVYSDVEDGGGKLPASSSSNKKHKADKEDDATTTTAGTTLGSSFKTNNDTEDPAHDEFSDSECEEEEEEDIDSDIDETEVDENGIPKLVAFTAAHLRNNPNNKSQQRTIDEVLQRANSELVPALVEGDFVFVPFTSDKVDLEIDRDFKLKKRRLRNKSSSGIYYVRSIKKTGRTTNFKKRYCILFSITILSTRKLSSRHYPKY